MPLPVLIGVGALAAKGAAIAAGVLATKAGIAGVTAVGVGVAGAVASKVAHDSGYSKGEMSGYKSGYQRASDLYEKKLRKQADAFLREEDMWKRKREEYESLLEAYEQCIKELERERSMSRDAANLLEEMQHRKLLLLGLAS